MKLVIAFALAVVPALAAAAADEPTVFYSKHFPGSKPEYISFEIARSGKAVYKESLADDQPLEFKLTAEEADEIFALADKLDHFKHPIESNLKVANMGTKTFRYTAGSAKHEVKFNYSLDENAKLLNDCFERLSESQMLLFDLERTVKFDRLGVNQTLLRIESAIDRKRLAGAERFLPLLDRVVKNDSYLNMARERAAFLASALRNPKPKAPAAQ
jgi:hypothetical protein